MACVPPPPPRPARWRPCAGASASATGRWRGPARSLRAVCRLRRARRATGCSPTPRRRKAPKSSSPAIRSTTRSKRSTCARRAVMAAASQAWRRRRFTTGACGSCGRCLPGAVPICASIFASAASRGSRTRPTTTNAMSVRGFACANAIAADAGQAPLQAAIDAARRQRVELGSRAAALILAHARPAGPGLVRLDRAIGSATDRDAAVYALRILLAATGGVEQLPDIVRATALFERLKDGNFRSTLSRTVIDARRDAVFLRRENRGLPAAASPQPGSIWDGRYRIGRLRDGVTIAALGAGRGGSDAGEARRGPAARPAGQPGAGSACGRAGALALRHLRGPCGRGRSGGGRNRRGESSRPGRASCRRSILCRPRPRRPCSAPTFHPSRHLPATKRAKVNPSWAFCLAIGGAVPMLARSLHTDRYLPEDTNGTFNESELPQSRALGDHRRAFDRIVQPVPDAAAARRLA